MVDDVSTPGRDGRFVGVDVVDLAEARAHRGSRNARLRDRVFTASERARIDAAPDPDRELWTLWAAKEAAFKVVSKILGTPPVFEHRAFEVRDDPGRPVGAVRYKGTVLPVTAQADDARIVVHAWSHPASMILVCDLELEAAEEVLGLQETYEEWRLTRFAEEERDAVRSRSSALVRLLARRDAGRHLSLPENRLSIRCAPGPVGRRPPYLYLDGAPLPRADVSLSHHGRRLAWALDLPWSSEPEEAAAVGRTRDGVSDRA